jgi:hypothetical protein
MENVPSSVLIHAFDSEPDRLDRFRQGDVDAFESLFAFISAPFTAGFSASSATQLPPKTLPW